ncbi:hypothetical protein HY631_04650 [Candidatus Uhrbacteria bacterium]|nr:hypothetical protein [Candidatus Uhrbacteria bacterium]
MWRCDTCGKQIKTEDDGWVEWVTVVDQKKGTSTGRDLRLVHHGKCQFNEQKEYKKDGGIIGDLGLSDFLGPDGLVALLELMERGEIPQKEVVAMIQRLHVPGYENARPHFKSAISEGVIEPNMAPGFYTHRDIEAVIAWEKRRRQR